MFSGKITNIARNDLEQAFKSLDIELDGFIKVRDLIEVLFSYSGNDDKLSINVKELA